MARNWVCVSVRNCLCNCVRTWAASTSSPGVSGGPMGASERWHQKPPARSSRLSSCSAERVRHKPLGEKEPEEATGWLPSPRPLKVGLTAGASTPDSEVGAVVMRMAELLGAELPPD